VSFDLEVEAAPRQRDVRPLVLDRPEAARDLAVRRPADLGGQRDRRQLRRRIGGLGGGLAQLARLVGEQIALVRVAPEQQACGGAAARGREPIVERRVLGGRRVEDAQRGAHAVQACLVRRRELVVHGRERLVQRLGLRRQLIRERRAGILRVRDGGDQ
jgi:hypothetical protein